MLALEQTYQFTFDVRVNCLKTLDLNHKGKELSANEREAYKTCVRKFMMMPGFVMNEVNKMEEGATF